MLAEQMHFWTGFRYFNLQSGPFYFLPKTKQKKMVCPLLWLRFTLEVIQIKIDFQISFQSEIQKDHRSKGHACRLRNTQKTARESDGLAPFQRQKGCSRYEAMVFQKEAFHPWAGLHRALPLQYLGNLIFCDSKVTKR